MVCGIITFAWLESSTSDMLSQDGLFRVLVTLEFDWNKAEVGAVDLVNLSSEVDRILGC